MTRKNESRDQHRMRKAASSEENGFHVISDNYADSVDPMVVVTNEGGDTVREGAERRQGSLRKQESYVAAMASEIQEVSVASGSGQSVCEEREEAFSHDSNRFPVSVISVCCTAHVASAPGSISRLLHMLIVETCLKWQAPPTRMVYRKVNLEI